MHIFISGIGGSGMTPLALIAHQAGHQVSGSDKQHSDHIDELKQNGITNISLLQTHSAIAQAHAVAPIDWYVYSSAISIEAPNSPEFQFCKEMGIRMSKRAELLNYLIDENNQKLIAIAGTHGKTTTTAMAIWLLLQNNVPISYLLPARTSYAEQGHYDKNASYFVYEADEFDRNFLDFTPHISLITGVDWDHPDVYPTRENYIAAFQQFITQSQQTFLWQSDAKQLNVTESASVHILEDTDTQINTMIPLPGSVNRQDAWLVTKSLEQIVNKPLESLCETMTHFPGVGRRFELIAPNIYTDYAHTPPKIRGAIQIGHEVAGDNLVVIYEGLHNTRQYFIKNDLRNLFDSVKALYIVPSYLAREDKSLTIWTPQDICDKLSDSAKNKAKPATLDTALKNTIQTHAAAGDTVLCLTAGGGGSLDEWLRAEFNKETPPPKK